MEPDTTKPGWNYRFVRYFLNNAQLTVLLFALVVVLGVGTFFRLRVEGFPAVSVPVAVVTTVVPGAGPETVQETVTTPLENALRDLEDVKEFTATSQANASVIVLNFNDGTDITTLVQDARTKIESVTLPEGVQTPDIFVPETGGPQFIVAVTGPVSVLELKQQAQALEDRVLDIDGVQSFNLTSGITEKVYIDLPVQYQTPQITEQIRTANISFPLGKSVINGEEVPIFGKSQVSSIDDIKNIPILVPGAPGMPSRIVKLGDIAAVYHGVDLANRTHRVGFLKESDNKFRMQPALLYEIRLESDADILRLGTDIETAVADTKAPDTKVEYTLVFNAAADAQRQVDEIVEGAIGGKWDYDSPIANVGFIFGGIWLLIIAMLLFLDWRSALISAAVIPLSFLATFIFLSIVGIQLNTLVLFSLVLVLGLIVDPAIVVLESIKRYMEVGHKGKDAVLRSTIVIGSGLFMSVVTSLIVFVPFGVVSGTFGQLIKYIPLTVFPALIASYFIPLIFLTWLGGKFLKGDTSEELRNEDDIHTLWPVARGLIRVNRYIVHHRVLSIAVIVLGLAIPIGISVALFSSGQVRQVQFAQPDDTQFLLLSIPRPLNQTYPQLQAQTAQVEEVLKRHAGVIKSFFYQSFEGGNSSTAISVFIELVEAKHRADKSPLIAEQLQRELRERFGERALAQELAAGPPTEAYPVSVRIFDNDPEKLRVASQKLADQLRSYGEVDAVITDLDRTTSELVVSVDAQKAAAIGLNAAAVYGQINGVLGERKLFAIGNEDVVIRTPESGKPTTVDALQNLQVFGQAGPVRVGDVATITTATTPGSIRSLNGERYTQVSARIKDSRDAITVQRKIGDWAKEHTGDLGVSDRAFEERAGVDEFEKSFQELFLAIGLSILATYLVFVVFFRSFVQPFIILFAVPLILIGVFPALAAFAGGQFGFLETIGILMVIGIVENVGIFLIDYANRKVGEGMDKKEAIALASGIRFRPVILTKITALAGLLPLAIFSPFWRGLAVVVIFGILSSGILSLFTTPVLYSWFTRQKKQPEQQPVLL